MRTPEPLHSGHVINEDGVRQTWNGRFCLWCLLPAWVAVYFSRYTSSVYYCRRRPSQKSADRQRERGLSGG